MFRTFRCVAFILLAGSFAPWLAGEEIAQSLVHRTPGNIELEITADGLSAIRCGGRQLATGGWSVFNGGNWFKDQASGVDTATFSEKSIERKADGTAIVRHVRGDLVCTATYAFDGEDVLISTRIENRHLSDAVNVVGFSGLTFDFNRPPDGLMMVQHITYFQAHGIGLCHPGQWARFGGSYAIDGEVGVATTPWRTGLMQTLTLWDYGSWEPDRRENDPQRKLLYFAVAPIPARGVRTLDFKLRVSANRDWQHLLQPYREHFQATFGPVRYHCDYRWIASDYVNKNQEAITATNPYGFYDGFRRIDTTEGVAAFCDKLVPALTENGGQGIILWGQGGDDPRGAMYRPDFDVLPPEVEQQWKTLQKRFQEAGLKLGVCTRPRHLAVRRDWKEDTILDINPADSGHREVLWKRFENMIEKGCTLFYLDSFGDSFEDVQLMMFLRERLGENILTFAEHQCDAMFPYSGGYSETTFVGNQENVEPHYRVWSGLDNWKLYQYLCPESQLISRLYQIEGELPEAFEPVERFYYRNRVTPLLPVSDFRRLGRLGGIQPEFVEGTGWVSDER